MQKLFFDFIEILSIQITLLFIIILFNTNQALLRIYPCPYYSSLFFLLSSLFIYFRLPIHISFSTTASDSLFTSFFTQNSYNFSWVLLLFFFYLLNKPRMYSFSSIKSLTCLLRSKISFSLPSNSIAQELVDDSCLDMIGISSKTNEFDRLLSPFDRF